MVVVLKILTKGYGARSFSYAAAVLWNYLCDDELMVAESVAEARLRTLNPIGIHNPFTTIK